MSCWTKEAITNLKNLEFFIKKANAICSVERAACFLSRYYDLHSALHSGWKFDRKFRVRSIWKVKFHQKIPTVSLVLWFLPSVLKRTPRKQSIPVDPLSFPVSISAVGTYLTLCDLIEGFTKIEASETTQRAKRSYVNLCSFLMTSLSEN